MALELNTSKRNTRAYPCTGDYQAPETIPGLDASLCRCQTCLDRAGGTWWIDAEQRADCRDKRKHKNAYLQMVYSQMEVGVGHEERSKQTKAQKGKRKHAEWAGEKIAPTTIENPELWS